jgi:hypothetical protein
MTEGLQENSQSLLFVFGPKSELRASVMKRITANNSTAAFAIGFSKLYVIIKGLKKEEIKAVSSRIRSQFYCV